MTTEDKIALKEFLVGSAIAIGITIVLLSIFFAMNGTANLLEAPPTPSDQRFEVIDTYKGCAVVRYTPANTATYKYFLDCQK